MNINKRGGDGFSKDKKLIGYINIFKNYINAEIKYLIRILLLPVLVPTKIKLKTSSLLISHLLISIQIIIYVTYTQELILMALVKYQYMVCIILEHLVGQKITIIIKRYLKNFTQNINVPEYVNLKDTKLTDEIREYKINCQFQ